MSANFTLGPSFKVRLHMLSDWHVGTGTGIPGSVDALLAKDAEGFPFVPAKTIVGIWRDAMERLTYGLDNGDVKGPWSKWVEAIFGIQPNRIGRAELEQRLSQDEPTYSHSRLAVGPALISEALRAAINLTGDIRLKQALVFIKPEIKIDENSGASENDMLRFAEMGRIGSILESECELDLVGLADEEKRTATALLMASAKLFECIGGKRRRGAGQCRFEIVGRQITQEVINRLSGEAPPASKLEVSDEDRTLEAANSDEEWETLEYALTLKTPVAVVMATLGNFSKTLDFIPGTYLLSHFTKGKNLFKYLANGDLQVSPATIEINGQRGLPVPRVFVQQKMEKTKVSSRLLETGDSRKSAQLKPLRDGFVSYEGAKFTYLNTPTTLLMHNTVKDEYQRPTSDEGGVYSRQAIAAGTRLRGEIRFKKSLGLDFSYVAKELRLGTSKKDDYGLASIQITPLSQQRGGADEDRLKDLQANDSLLVYLESDVLLRNSNLRSTSLAADMASEICRLLNETVEDVSKKVSLNLESESLAQTRRLESWQTSWGFPRPTLTTMAAGSCIKLTVESGNISAAQLRSLENSGIGERRGEGYGRIRFDLKLLTEPIVDWVNALTQDKSKRDDAPVPIEPEMNAFANHIETTVWRDAIHEAVLLLADQSAKRMAIFGFVKGGKPPMSQIGGLRSVVARLKDDGSNKHIVVDWLTHLKKTPNRLDKWETFGEIENLFADGHQELLWAKLEWQEPPILLEDAERGDLKHPKEQLWAEAMRALFDACMRAHKREGGVTN